MPFFLTLALQNSVAPSEIAIIPQPAVLRKMPSAPFMLTEKTRIVTTRDTRSAGEALREAVRPATGLPLPLSTRNGDGVISLSLDKNLEHLGPEGYTLDVNPKGVTIRAFKPAGAFYGVQTLRQLLPTEAFSKTKENVAWTIPSVAIQDKPRFAWRGLHLDVGRNFMPKEFVIKFLDSMALHKLNTFHWHLTEDQGWRIEIKKYPKLTEVGAWRKDTMLTYSPATYTGKPHGGFYTQKEIKEVVAHAAKLHINVVPEIEMPGHSQAAIAAYPELGVTGDKLEVATKWGVIENILNADDSTIKFMQDVLKEVLDLFPSKFIHIGGDEAVKTQWEKSPKIQARIKQLGLKDEHELQSWFIKQMDTWLAARGRRLIGWDEILEGGLAPGATVMSWRGISGGIAAAKAGHDVVMAPNSHTYFDHYQSQDTKKEPHAIGGFLPLEKVYAFEPIPTELSAEQAKHVLGGQAQLWTEYIRTPNHVEYMAFPRAAALSEAVWSPKDKRDYADFSKRLPAYLQRLTHLQINYRKP